MRKFTKALRQQIVREFAVRHNGQYNPHLFVEEVRAQGENHPAHAWFQWDRDKAAGEYWLWQAREFASGLTVSFKIEEIGKNRKITIREIEAPLVQSPMDGRRDGGGYELFDPENPEHMTELCRQAAVSLTTWFTRYRGAIQHAGGSVGSVEKLLKLLQAASPEEVDEAA